MKYVLSTGFFLYLFLIGLGAQPALALSTGLPFGGRVTATSGSMTCVGGTGPVTQQSAGQSPSQTYFYQSGTRQAPSVNKWVLGLYQQGFGNCYTGEGIYRVYQTTLNPTIWAVSRVRSGGFGGF